MIQSDDTKWWHAYTNSWHKLITPSDDTKRWKKWWNKIVPQSDSKKVITQSDATKCWNKVVTHFDEKSYDKRWWHKVVTQSDDTKRWHIVMI